MEKIKILGGMDLDQAVELLLESKKQGKSVYCEFNGHTLYSDDVTMDSAYLEVLGKTKTDYDKEQQEWLENQKREEERAQQIAYEKIPEWVQQGRKYIYPQKLGEWRRCVRSTAKGINHGLELNTVLEAMDALSKGESFEKVNEMIDNQNYSGDSHSIVMGIIVKFCKNGPEFYETVNSDISLETQQIIDEQKQLNLKYQEELDNELQM